MPELLLVTGLSGAGKSLAMRALEDIGYFCVDNLPSSLLLPLLSTTQLEKSEVSRLAVTVDVRGGDDFGGLLHSIEQLNRQAVKTSVIFLDAEDIILVHRYKETRRSHPLSVRHDISIEQAIADERKLLLPLYSLSDYVIDTGLLSTAALRERVTMLFMSSLTDAMPIGVLSFGFKFGVPRDADLVFDVRCLPNPYYIPALRDKTGLCAEVYDYVFSFADADTLFERYKELLSVSLPMYLKEGKSQLTIAFGCTGGKHRSISFARRTADVISQWGYSVGTMHRDGSRGTFVKDEF